MLQVGHELGLGDAVGSKPVVQIGALVAELHQEVLAELLEDGLQVGRRGVTLETLSELAGDAVLLELGKSLLLLLTDLLGDGGTHGLDVVEAEVVLCELVGQLGEHVVHETVDGDLGLGDLGLGGLLALSDGSLGKLELDGLGLGGVHADEALVEALGHLALAEVVQAVLEVDLLEVLATLDLDVHEVIGLNGTALDVLVLAQVAAEGVDLGRNLGLSGLLGGKRDLDGLVGAQGELGAHGVTHLEGEVLAGDNRLDIGEVGIADGNDILSLKHLRGGLVHEGLGGLAQDSVLADVVVDHGTRGLAGTEAREAILLGQLLVRVGNGLVHSLGVNGDADLDHIVLKTLYRSLQRSSN